MSRRAIANASLVASSVFGVVAVVNGYEAFTGGDYASGHNQKVEACAGTLGAVAATAARLPIACEDLYDSFDYQASLEDPTVSGDYILPPAEYFRAENTWTETDNESQSSNYKNNALVAGALSLGLGLAGKRIRRKQSGYKIKVDPNNPLSIDLVKMNSTSLEEFSDTYWSFVKKQAE